MRVYQNGGLWRNMQGLTAVTAPFPNYVDRRQVYFMPPFSFATVPHAGAQLEQALQRL